MDTFKDYLSQLGVEESTFQKGLVVGSSLIAFLLAAYWSTKKNPKINLPGPPSIPGIGSYEFITAKLPHLMGEKFHDDYKSKTVYVKMFFLDGILTKDWKLIKQIVDHRKDYPAPLIFRSAVSYRSGTTMFTSEGEEWKSRRHTLEPMFHVKLLKHNYETILKKVYNMIRVIDKQNTTNVVPLFHRLTTDLVGEVALGVDFKVLENEDVTWEDEEGNKLRIIDLFDYSLAGVNARLFMPFQWSWNLPLSVFRKEKQAVKILRSIFNFAIAKERERNNQSKIESLDQFEGVTMMSLLLASSEVQDNRKHPYTQDQILAECFSLFGAGTDTTASSASFLTHFLATNPETQFKIFEEISRIAGSEDPFTYVPKYEDLNQMKYIEGAVKEALRLLPPAPSLIRIADTFQTPEGVNIPPGTMLFPNIYGYHRDPDYFPDPLKFKPERWETAEYPLLTFGYGQRACFGRRFAMNELKAMLFILVQKYQISEISSQPLDIENMFGIRPKDNKYIVKFNPRK